MNEKRTNYINTLCTKINEKLAPLATVRYTTVEKHNNQLLDAITFEIPNVKISPIIYINDILDEMPNVENAAEMIIKIYKNSNAPKLDIDSLSKNLKNEDWIKAHVLPKLTASTGTDDISISFMDMYISFYVKVDERSTITLKKNHTSLETKTLLQFAKINAMSSYKFKGMLETLREMKPEIASFLPDEDEEQMYILSSKNGFFGAAAIIDEHILKEIAESLNSNLYILPSSIHECIILKADTPISKDQLQNTVRQINSTEVSQNDFLSDSVFLYIKDREHLQFA